MSKRRNETISVYLDMQWTTRRAEILGVNMLFAISRRTNMIHLLQLREEPGQGLAFRTTYAQNVRNRRGNIFLGEDVLWSAGSQLVTLKIQHA